MRTVKQANDSSTTTMIPMKKSNLTGSAAAVLLFFVLQPFAAVADAPYDGHVQCDGDNSCKIDIFLVRGFRAFSQCQVCHGLDGNGSTIAPSLMAKLQEIDHATFVDRVTNGFKGQIGVMPAWGSNPNVMKHLDSLYAYLKARSDKIIPPGRLERYDRGGSSGGSLSSAPRTSGTMSADTGNTTPSPAPDEKHHPSSSGVYGSRGNLKPSE